MGDGLFGLRGMCEARAQTTACAIRIWYPPPPRARSHATDLHLAAHQAAARTSHLSLRQQWHTPALSRSVANGGGASHPPAPPNNTPLIPRFQTAAIVCFSTGSPPLRPLPPVRQVYDKYKDEDGFLYMTYSGENTFGCVL
jgi:hypothetical protein